MPIIPENNVFEDMEQFSNKSLGCVIEIPLQEPI